ncbi:ABC transporter ATP-binding protein [Sedimentibacter sp.]|uniref:ABC transporter ATP-binding protein n=1 Tax=Sedimentibacter sp. TaxID=1960295 RepID=UPI0028A28F5B|nr:ABC transporter ATP-binding protein [Sedimentibacter sp.]
MNEKNLILDVKNLVVRYETEDGIVNAVNGLDLQIEQGKALGLVGETGAGKTTAALSLLRLIPKPPGVERCDIMNLDGLDMLSLSVKELEKVRGKDISMIFQDPMTALNPVLTVGDQIAESIHLHEDVSYIEAQKLAVSMLELVGIPGERAGEYPHQFSGGMKQRVVIAIALACHPKLLIADEPTTALDVTIQAQVLELMKDLRKQYKTSLIMITHDLGIVAEICDEVAVMYSGNIVEKGTLEDVFNRTKHPYTEGLFNSLPNINDRKAMLTPIKGLMPDPTNLPEGCPFQPRCPYAGEDCTRPQVIRHISDTHYVRCGAYNRPGFHINRKER